MKENPYSKDRWENCNDHPAAAWELGYETAVAVLDKWSREQYLPGRCEDLCCTELREWLIDEMRAAIGLPIISEVESVAAYNARQRLKDGRS